MVSLLLRRPEEFTAPVQPPKSRVHSQPKCTSQTWILLTVALAKVPTAWHMACVLFIAPPPPHGSYHCHGNTDSWSWKGHCPLDNDTISQCSGWRAEGYPDYLSVATQWGLVCKKAVVVTSSQSTYLFGILVGGAVCLKLLPRFGPRRLLLFGLGAQPTLGVLLALNPFLPGHFVLRFLLACSCAFVFTSAAVFCRGVARSVCLIEIGWSIGVFTLAGLSAVAPAIDITSGDWRRLYLLLAGLSAVPAPVCSWVLPDEILPAPKPCPKGSSNPPAKAEIRGAKPSVMSLVQLSALHGLWAATIVSFFGGLLNVRNLVQGDIIADLSLMVAAAGGAEIAGFFVGAVLVGTTRLQRFAWLSAALFVGGLACIIAGAVVKSDAYIEHNFDDILLPTAAMICRVAIAASLGVLPSLTEKCHLFNCLLFARVFLLSAPFIGALGSFGSYLPVTAYGMLAVAGAVFAVVCAVVENNKGTKTQKGKGEI